MKQILRKSRLDKSRFKSRSRNIGRHYIRHYPCKVEIEDSNGRYSEREMIHVSMYTFHMDEKRDEREKISPGAPGIQELLAVFNKETMLPKGRFLKFNVDENADELSVYNPSPIDVDGVTYLLARVEKKNTESGSTVMLFCENENGEWDIVEDVPVLNNVQDPFYCGMIDGLHVIGWVQTYEETGSPQLGYRTVFYRFENSILELEDEDIKQELEPIETEEIGDEEEEDNTAKQEDEG